MDSEKSKLVELLVSALSEKERDCSIEFGTPGKSGAVKVHLNLDDVEECKQRIEEVLKQRKSLVDQYNVSASALV